MRVLNVCVDDWAQFQYDNMNALRSVGVDCNSVKLNRHAYYDNQSDVIEQAEILKMIKYYDVIQYFHDSPGLLIDVVRVMSENQKLIVYHTSSHYRKNYRQLNLLMNPHAHKCVNAMPEFMELGAWNPIYMVGAVDTDKLAPVYRGHVDEIKFAHYPSNPKVKGSNDIIRMMTGRNFFYNVDQVGYADQLKRMSECDVYIELFSDKDGNGMPYGNFGITALEAAALGKLVITQCKGIMHYMQAYQKPFFYIADDEEQFQFLINSMIKHPEKIRALQKEKRELLVKNHSYQATGNYILSHVLN